MVIRSATVEDSYGMAVTAVEAWKWAYVDILPPEFIEQRTNVDRRAARTREIWKAEAASLVAVDDTGDVIGFASENSPCALAGFDSEIGGLYVHPKAAGQGVGSALVAEMVARFIEKDARSMAIYTLAENTIGRNFYRKIGGREHSFEMWHGFPSMWFVWDDLARIWPRK